MSVSEPELQKPWSFKFIEDVMTFFLAMLLLFSALFAISSIAEISARESVLGMLSERVAGLKSEFVDLSKTDGGSASSGLEGSEDIALQHDVKRRKQRLFDQIAIYDDLKRALQVLIAVGSDKEGQTLRSIHV